MSIAIGDLVTERPTRAVFTPSPWSPNYQRVRQLIQGPRTGEVVALHWKQSAKGRKTLYAEVLWAGARRPSLHGAMRLVKIEQPAA